MSTPTKDYSDVNRLALGHLAHEQLAQKLLQQTRSSEELMSVLRAGHDRIQYFLCGKPVAMAGEEIQGTVEVMEISAPAEHVERVRVFELNELNNKVQALQIEVNTLTGNLVNAEKSIATANASVLELTEQLAQAQAHAEVESAELEKTRLELTTAYMSKEVAEQATRSAEAKLADIMDNYEVVDEDAEAETETAAVLADAADTSNDTYYVPTKPELLEIALKHGFRVRQQADGAEDLNGYVYATIYDGIKLSHEKSQ